MDVQTFRHFTPAENHVWRTLFERQTPLRPAQMADPFLRGIGALGLSAERIPDLDEVNRRLRQLSGFEGIPVEGLESSAAFYPALADGKFPIGNFIRSASDINYTPAPDVFHDLYGHLPFLADRRYADFTREFGRRASEHLHDPERLQEFERLYWFGVEFSLVETPQGRRIFGAGIASSFGECAYALGSEPEVLPFDPEVIRRRPFRIDEFQKTIFVLRDEAQLYGCLANY